MNSYFEIVAHRGAATIAQENTIQAFQKAIELGADAVELDVRLTKDYVPVVFHYFYLDKITDLAGPIFNYTIDELAQARFIHEDGCEENRYRISTLAEVLDTIGGRLGLEIEIKGPELEAPRIIGKVLQEYHNLWESIEMTSYEPLLLRRIQEECPGIVVDLLYPRSEEWMKLDVVAYTAAHKSLLAGARAVHLHPTQLSDEVVNKIRALGIEIHAWDVNDKVSLDKVVAYQIPRMCTDQLEQALTYRKNINS